MSRAITEAMRVSGIMFALDVGLTICAWLAFGLVDHFATGRRQEWKYSFTAALPFAERFLVSGLILSALVAVCIAFYIYVSNSRQAVGSRE